MPQAMSQSRLSMMGYVYAIVAGEWLLVPSGVALAGGWLVWLACAAGFFWLRDVGGHNAWSSLVSSVVVGAIAASPFLAAAFVFRRTCERA
jgi:hypothetical protein